MSSDEIEQIKAAIAALEAQRPVLGDAVVETALAPLREKLNALARAAPAADERKRITILFSDLAGFTATSETMDPEEVHAIMDIYFSHMSQPITQHGGTIEKYIGDAVMALFGAPKALENHEEMAVRAALAMQEALEALNQELEQDRGVRLAMRIGVNTGLVLFGSMGGRIDGDFAAVGDTINLTSRLESAAPVGGILISADTARPLHAIFDFEPPQQITVKGKREPITVYVVGGERARRGRVRGIAGLSAPMVGRDAELATLQAAFQRALSDRCWQAAAIVGEAGIGKSRLQREFLAWVAQAHAPTHILNGRCYAHTQGTPYYLIADLMRGLFNLGSDASPTVALEQVGEALRIIDPETDEAEFRYRLGSLAGVLGFPIDDDPLQSLEPEQRRDRTFLSLERVLLAASAAAPLLVVVDDLHWADTLSLSFVERILQMAGDTSTSDRAALLLAISRPAEEPESALARVLHQAAQPPHHTLTLTPLDTGCADTLIAELIGEAALPSEVVSLVLQHAQGNPFFVEEIIRTLIEDGTLQQDPESGAWQVTRGVDDIDVPDTVQGVLAARLDRLPGADKRVVQHAAIIGRTFWQKLLAEAAKGSDGDKAQVTEDVLSRLEQRQLVQRSSESHIADDWEWMFQHVLAQEVAYASVTREMRRRVHVRVARWLEDQIGDQTTALVPMVAYHYERGGIAEKALEYLQRAGEQAAAQFANESAVDYFSRALALLAQGEQEGTEVQARRYALLLGREGVYGLTGQRESQAADLAALKALAEEMDDDRRRAEVALRYAAYYDDAASDFPAALAAAQDAVRWARRASEPYQETGGLIEWGVALWRQGDFEDADQRLAEALALGQEKGDLPGEAKALLNLGNVSYLQGDYQSARDRWEQALEIYRALGDRRGEAVSLNNLVAVYDGLGDPANGQACSEQALAIYQMIGDRRGEALALGNIGSNHYALGNLDAARDYQLRSLSLRRAIGDQAGEALTLENLSLVLHDLGAYQEAQRHCERALEIERAIGDRQGEGYSLTYLAMILEKQSQWEAASAAYEEALRLRQEIGQDPLVVDDLAGLARVALEQAQTERAMAHVEEALAWITEHDVDGIEYPLRVYLTAHDVLIAAGQNERAAQVLAAAQALLQDQAARISDPAARRGFLENVPLHIELQERISRYS